MKEMKKILAFFLCFAMVLGFVPVQAFAADTEAVLDAAIFCSDVHGDTTALTNVFSGVAKSGLTFSSVSFNGDTCLTVEKTTSTVTAALGQTPSILFSYAASHDTENSSDISTNWDYSGEAFENDNYIVYTIRENDMRYYENATTAAANFVEWAKTADTTKPLFIISHRPLHARRNDNAGASTWFNAIYEVAKTMDVVVFWAHNHTSESDVDIEHYYIAKGGQLYLNTSTSGSSEELSDEEELALATSNVEAYAGPGSNSGTESNAATGEYYETNFTYMNAGYIDANNQNPARIGVATTVQIYEDKMVFQDYNKSGAYTGTYAHNETVFFEHADLSEEEVVVVTPAQLVVTGTNEYTVGDTYAAPTVSVTYSDGSSKEVTDYEMTSEPELDMNTAGTYLLTFTYSETVNGQTYKAEARFTVTVKEAETSEPTTEPTTTEPVENTVYDENEINAFSATGEGLTDLTVTDAYSEEMTSYVSSVLVTDGEPEYQSYVAYNFALTGNTEGQTVAYTMLVEDGWSFNEMVLYHVAEDGTTTPVSYTTSVDADGWTVIEFSTALTGTFVYGEKLVVVEEGATLTDLVIADGYKTRYFLSDSYITDDGYVCLELDSLTVTAYYSDGTSRVLEFDGFDSSKDGYSLSFPALQEPGEYTITLSYDYGEDTITHTFSIWIFDDTFTDETASGSAAEVTVVVDTPNTTAVTVTENTTESFVTKAMSALEVETFVSYNIDLTYHDTELGLGGYATVTMPIPEGVTNPVVYYVSDDGATVTDMKATKTEDGTGVTFTTDHFSTYVVGESTEITVPDPDTATGSGSTTTTTKKTVYVLTSSISSGNDYLIVNGNSAGSYYALANNSGSVAATGVTVKSGDVDGDGDTETYIELDDATDELWTVGGSYTFQNGSYYLGYTGNNDNRQFGLGTTARTWSYSNNRLSIRPGNTTYYLRYNSGWTWTSNNSASGRSVYFYIPTEIEVETTTTVSGTYSIVGNPASYDNVAAIAGSTITLGSTLIFKPDSGAATTTDTSATAVYAVVEGGDPNGVISGISGNTLTLSGEVGKALVKVIYSTDFGTVTAYITINATAPVYGMDVIEPESVQLKIGSTLELEAAATINGTANETETAKITWSSSNGDIATVDENGVVTAVAEGDVTITATYTDPNEVVHTDEVSLNIVDAVWDLELCAPTYAEAEGVTADNFSKGTYFTHTDSGYVQATSYVEGTNYYTQSTYVETAVTESAFTAGTYYCINEDGSYQLAEEYASGTTYYVPNAITKPIVIKEVENGDTYQNVWAVIWKDGEDIGALDDYTKLTWVSSNSNIASIDAQTGKVTFNGGEGTVIITAIYEYAEGKSVTDTVVFSVSADRYYIPEDGTDDFPEYPNEGAIRFDKTATAVGNFSQTGIAKVELSMTGVPFTTGNELDVVVMLDQSTSMDDNRIAATVAATKAFIESIVINEDGSFNENRVYVGYFNGSNTYDITDTANIGGDLASIDSKTELDALFADIDDEFDGSPSTSGTQYAVALKKCYDRLASARTDGTGDDRQQFCVFMSDGVPTTYQYGANAMHGSTSSTSDGYDDMKGMFTGTNYDTRSSSYVYEYYSTQMKSEGVTIYTVGLGLEAKNNAWSSASATQCLNAASLLLNDISGPAKETELGTGSDLNKKDSYFFSVEDEDAATEMANVFKNIAQKILDAAKDVKVTDKIADEYTMVFDFPNSTVGEILEGQEFYIEVLDYKLNAVKDSAGNIVDYTRGTATSLLKLYLGTNADGSYYAATANGSTNGSNKFATPAFAKVTLGASGSKYHWSTDSAKGDCGISVSGTYTDDNGNTQTATFYFVSDGTGEYNMTSGAYAYGTPTTVEIENTDESTGETTKTESTTCEDLIIATPYFVYNASTRMLIWTAEKLSSSELALSYFLYLENSGGFTGADGAETEIPAGTYETNDYAYLNYINFNGNPCEQEFPVPQMTWNGAQVSYVFYLVNEDGKPVNRAGKVVPFSEAVYVTDTYTYSIIWNKLEQTAGLEAERLAVNLVPDVYELYDKGAAYKIHVYENENYVNLNNHFVIESGLSNYTTYVFNTKADATKYTNPGTYVAYNSDTATTNRPYMCKDYEGVTVTFNDDGTIASASYSGSYTQVTPNLEGSAPADFKDDEGGVYYIDGNGDVYTIVYKNDGTEVHNGFDFSNTTVAFAVMWKPELVEDVVVVDFGLDVVIDVTTNDALASGVVGVRTTAPSGIEMNKGTYQNAAQQITTDIMIGDLKIGTASVESLSAIRFSLDKTNGMQFSKPVEFYYESAVNYYKDGTNLSTENMYSKVTVIPATTVYYEDEFVTLMTYTKDGTTGKYTGASGWKVNSVTSNATQQQDRPGESKISETLDADNVYGYDSAYEAMSIHSLSNAAMIHVDANQYGTAEFTFYGTGFDIISMTSNTTGIINVTVKQGNTVVVNKTVDTYYGYTYGVYECTYTLNEDNKWELTNIGDTEIDPDKYEGTIYNSKDELIGAKQNGTTATGAIYVWKPVNNAPNAIYQVPVLKVADLPYGQYTAVIRVSYYSALDHTAAEGYDMYLDAIRIYDPTGVASGETENKTVEDAYKADGEGWPVYEELRNNVIAASGYAVTENDDGTVTVSGELKEGAVFIDGNENAQLADYVSYGPNNELYLAPNQAVAFNVTASGNVADIQLGIKVANGSAVTYEINGDSYTVNTATDMYYSILEYAEAGTVVIKNVSGGILSLTNIKVTHISAPAEESGISLLSMDAESVGVALMMLRRAPVIDEPEETEPTEPETEPTEPETEPTEPETEPTEPETEPTEPETEPTEPETEPETEPTEPETEPTEPETKPTEPETEPTEPETQPTEPEVPAEPETFEPAKLNVYLSSSSVKVGKSVIVTVTTSADVQSLSVNGEAVTRYVYSRWTGTKTWVVTVDAESVGEMAIDVVAYNAAGLASETVTNTVTVTGNSGSLLEKLLGWLFG